MDFYTQNFTEKINFSQSPTPLTLYAECKDDCIFAECKIDQFKKSFCEKAAYKLIMKLIFLNLNFLLMDSGLNLTSRISHFRTSPDESRTMVRKLFQLVDLQPPELAAVE